jgi:hypothetical protein
MEPTILQITDGTVALTVVDKAAVNYSDAWQAPGGKTAATATLADYVDATAAWTCQVTSGKLTPSKQSNRADRAATFCSPASSSVSPSQTTYTLDVSFFQDADVRGGLSSYLFENDTAEAFFLLGLGDGDAAPRAVGRVILVAGGFGGDPQANLTDSISLDLVRKPDVLFGRTGSTRLVTGTGTVTDTPAA